MARRTITIWNQGSFDSAYSPPAPRLVLEIAGPDLNDWHVVETAIVDTGADWTIIPENILSRIEGRNLLNWLKVLIDGPNQTVELLE